MEKRSKNAWVFLFFEESAARNMSEKDKYQADTFSDSGVVLYVFGVHLFKTGSFMLGIRRFLAITISLLFSKHLVLQSL